MNRKVLVECVECGEPREHAAKGLCFACYRRQERQSKSVDLHNPGISRDQTKLIRAHAQVMQGLALLRVGKKHVREILTVLAPYLSPVREYIRLEDQQKSTAE